MATISLAPVDYWRLRALTSDVQRVKAEARFAIASVQAAQDAWVLRVAGRATGSFELDDEKMTITISDEKPEAKE